MKEISRAIIFICIGTALGFGAHNAMMGDTIDKLSESISGDDWRDTLVYLSIAKSIRSEKYDEALKLTEGMIALNVNSYTDNGKKIDLNEYEVSTFNKVTKYKKEICKNKCLNDLSSTSK